MPWLHGQRSPCAGERQDLAVLVDQEPDDVVQLSSKSRIGGELELPDPMRLQTAAAPDPRHRREAVVCDLGHGNHRPMRSFAGRIATRESNRLILNPDSLIAGALDSLMAA